MSDTITIDLIPVIGAGIIWLALGGVANEIPPQSEGLKLNYHLSLHWTGSDELTDKEKDKIIRVIRSSLETKIDKLILEEGFKNNDIRTIKINSIGKRWSISGHRCRSYIGQGWTL